MDIDVPASYPIIILLSPVVKAVAESVPIKTLLSAPSSIAKPVPDPNTTLSESKVNEWNEPEIVSEPVICKSLESVAW